MDLSWIGIALLFGLGARQLGQAPLLGFLIAGFALAALGIDPGATLEWLKKEVWTLPVLDQRGDDEILGYNAHGHFD